MIPYSRQEISKEDIEAVQNVLYSDFLTQGPVVPKFEQAVADLCGANYAVATNSATSALHIACLALDLGLGDILWTSAITFAASANCALYCGASVGFVDIDPITYNISINDLEQKLIVAKANDSLPKVVVVVHMCGQPCDMKALYKLKEQYGFSIIEDASHAIGSTFESFHTGSCTYSDITVFSFHPVKIITTGEGGMCLTSKRQLYRKLLLLRSHGITRDFSEFEGDIHGAWHYQQISLGYNYRMSDIAAALGLSQLSRLHEFVSRRSSIATKYTKKLSNLPLDCPRVLDSCTSSWHLYVIQLSNDTENQRRSIFEQLRKLNIQVNVHYLPVYHHPYYQKLGFKVGSCPNAETYYQKALSLPIFPLLSNHQQDYVIQTLTSILTK